MQRSALLRHRVGLTCVVVELRRFSAAQLGIRTDFLRGCLFVKSL
jgi:hypothetical protein